MLHELRELQPVIDSSGEVLGMIFCRKVSFFELYTCPSLRFAADTSFQFHKDRCKS